MDLVYELRVYLDDWLGSVEVNDFEEIKELLLTEQIEQRVPLEIRHHYLDDWEEFKSAMKLAEKCDRYEALMRDTRRLESRSAYAGGYLRYINNDSRDSGRLLDEQLGVERRYREIVSKVIQSQETERVSQLSVNTDGSLYLR